MGADQSTASPTKRKTKRSSSVKYVPPSDGYLDEFTVYNHEKAYTQKELVAGAKTLEKRLKKLESQIDALSASEGKGFQSLYEGIKDGNNSSSKHSNDPANKELNRYTNIVAYDSTRVSVKPNHYNMGTDYINANFVDGYKKKNMYIAAQGPVPGSIYSFWQMLMEQKGTIIVMVTNLTEGTRLKCHQYWPEATHTETHGDITVEGLDEKVAPMMVTRKFSVTYAGETREVIQFQYTAWPDHGVPATTEELLKFRHTVRESFESSSGPIITHCSAGVGRTGTFIGLDRYLDSCTELDDSLTVLDVVKNMRKCRNFMVQAQAQFEYLYMACYDGLVVLLEKVNRDLAMANMSDEERHVQKQSEIEKDIQGVTERFWQRCHEFVPGQKVNADVKHSLPEVAKAQELKLAARVTPSVRLASLAKSKEIWVERKNVPMSASEHGYAASTAKLEDRLSALGNSRLNWTACYEDAVKTWQSAQDHDGVMYDIGHQLTSIESRVGSLSAAESAWTLRGGKQSLNDQLQMEKMAEVQARLESLQSEMVHADDRWRARGDGMRQPQDQETADSAHTVDAVGGLASRFQMLQTTQQEWKKRGNWTKFDDDKFYGDIQKIEEQEGAVREAQEKQAAADKAAVAAVAEGTKKEQKAAEKKQKAEEADRLKKETTKLKMRQKSAIQEEWSAIKAQEGRDGKKRAESEEKQRVIDEAQAKVDAKAAEEQAAKDSKAAAAKKASKFLKKQSK